MKFTTGSFYKLHQRIFILLLLVQFMLFPVLSAITEAQPSASVQNIIIEERDGQSIYFFAALLDEANPSMPPSTFNKITNHANDYTEAWIQITFPNLVAKCETHRYKVRFSAFPENMVLLSDELVNFGETELEGMITDSIRVAVKKGTSEETVSDIVEQAKPYIEVLDEHQTVQAIIPITTIGYDASFGKTTAQGFSINISYGRIRTLKPSPTLFAFLPEEVYNNYLENPDAYCVIDLFGAKSKTTENPVLGVEFKVEHRDDLWAVPSNAHVYFSSDFPAPYCDNLLWNGPEFISITLLYKKPEAVAYPHQIYDKIHDVEITAFFSPVGYGSLKELRGDTIYSPKLSTKVDLSHFEPWMFE